MTPLEKQQIWDALYKCTRNGYPGATYETYDSPKDPRVRGGRYSWKRAQLRDIFEQLVKWGDSNEPTAAWRELLKYKTKIPPACLRAIYQSITFGLPTPTYTISTISAVINDGASEPFTVTTTNVPDGTVLYWKIVPTGVNPATSADFVGGVMNGSFVITGNSGGDTINTVDNILWKPDTFFYLEIMTGSIAGPVVTFSGNVEIDRGQAPLRTVWDNIANVPVSNPNDVNEWQLFYNISGTGSWSLIFTSVVVVGNTVDLYSSFGSPGTTQVSDFLFTSNANLKEFLDFDGWIYDVGFASFDGTVFLENIYLPNVQFISSYAFFGSGASTVNPPYATVTFPICTNVETSAFEQTRLFKELHLPLASVLNTSCFHFVTDMKLLDIPAYLFSPGDLITNYIFDFNYTFGQTRISLDSSWQNEVLNVNNDYFNTPLVNLTTISPPNIMVSFYNAPSTIYGLGGTYSGSFNFAESLFDVLCLTIGGPDFSPFNTQYYFEITGVSITQADFSLPTPISGVFVPLGSLTIFNIQPTTSGVGKSFTFSVYEGTDNTGPLVVSQACNITF